MIRLTYDFKLISKDNEKFRSKSGRYFLSSKFKEFENKVRLFTKMQYRYPPLQEDVKVSIIAKFKDKRHADTPNLFKSICDALSGYVYLDDRQIKIAECIVQEKEPQDSFIIIIKRRSKCSNKEM